MRTEQRNWIRAEVCNEPERQPLPAWLRWPQWLSSRASGRLVWISERKRERRKQKQKMRLINAPLPPSLIIPLFSHLLPCLSSPLIPSRSSRPSHFMPPSHLLSPLRHCSPDSHYRGDENRGWDRREREGGRKGGRDVRR